jgi:hypothetical protein
MDVQACLALYWWKGIPILVPAGERVYVINNDSNYELKKKTNSNM